MTDAQLERIEPDPFLANAFLLRARGFADDASLAGLGAEGRQVLLHGATIAPCDAVLAINGFQVVGVEGGHVLRIEQAAAFLPGVDQALVDQLDDTRVSRNQVSYAAGFAEPGDLDAAADAVAALIRHVEDALRPHLPEWLVGE
ncbi:MAG TPA: hypothetical protein VF529_12615 [Solirubrobacteraceae bacterium]